MAEAIATREPESIDVEDMLNIPGIKRSLPPISLSIATGAVVIIGSNETFHKVYTAKILCLVGCFTIGTRE